MPYLTGDGSGFHCVVSITIESDDYYVIACIGALNDLAYAHNWEEYGSQTPSDAASHFLAAMATIEVVCDDPQDTEWVLGESQLGLDTIL